MERWLGFWFSTRRSIRPGTARVYRSHIERYLVPHLGGIRLAELKGRDIARMFAVLADARTRTGRAYSPATLQRIRATLRAALNGAIREGLIRDNPARRIELANPHRPHPVVWTEQQIANWENTGQRPAVAVWTLQQLACFLHGVRDDHHQPLWWLIALRGLRRGEACGLLWDNVDLDNRTLTITQQLTCIAGELIVCEPKSRASRRTVALDQRTVQILRQHAIDQREAAEAAGRAWQETGYVFTRPDGTPLRPNSVTQRLRNLVRRSGLPPVRLHDLRHGAATLAHAAGVDLKTVQDQLGHASIVLTADTYTSVLDIRQHHAAAATARLVLDAARGIARGVLRRPKPGPAQAPPGHGCHPEPSGRPGKRKKKRRTAAGTRRRSRQRA